MSGGGGGGGSGTQTTIVEPWAAQKPHLQNVFRIAEQLQGTGGPQYYPGQTLATLNPAQMAGITGGLDVANRVLPGHVNSLLSSQEFGLAAPDVYNNPAIQRAAEGAVRPVMDQLQESVLPKIRSGAVESGQVGGSRQGVLESRAIRDATTAAMDRTASLYSDAYGQGLDAMIKTMGLSPQTLNTALMPSGLTGQFGDQLRGFGQEAINADIDRWNYNQNLPWQTAFNYRDLVQGNYGGQTTAPGAPEPSMGSKLAGAAATGLGTYGMLTSPAIGMTGPVGMGIAGGMALLSLL